MTENVENLIIEHLRAIRSRADQIAEDLTNVKMRITSLETQTANIHSDNAIANARMDSIEKRLDRIERRLELKHA